MTGRKYITTLGSAPSWRTLTVVRTGQRLYKTDDWGVALEDDGTETPVHGATHVLVGDDITAEKRLDLISKRHPWNPRYPTNLGEPMRYEHLPALNRYTSKSQYEAMQQIDRDKSFTPLLMQGNFSKTIGSLLRSAWIAPGTDTDPESGVVREVWTITEAGRHAMKLYEAKAEEWRKLCEAQEQAAVIRKNKEDELFQCAKEYYRLEIARKDQETRANAVANSLVGYIPPAQYRPVLNDIYEKARKAVLSETTNTLTGVNQ